MWALRKGTEEGKVRAKKITTESEREGEGEAKTKEKREWAGKIRGMEMGNGGERMEKGKEMQEGEVCG